MNDAGDREAESPPADGGGNAEGATASGGDGGGASGTTGTGDRAAGSDGPDEVEELRAAVEEQYDFDEFGPADMAQMSAEEWDAAFDPETWITGEELIDRVEADLKSRVQSRDVFARVERYEDPPRVLAYAETSYAMVYPDGSVEGEGTVLRDVKPTVALASMESYDVPEKPEGDILPDPAEVPEGGSELGNNLLQIIAGVQLLAALVLFVAGGFSIGSRSANAILLFVAGIGFLLTGIFLFTVVANARLSDAFRSEEFRSRLRGVGLADGERPEFLPPPPGAEGSASEADGARSTADSDASATGESPPVDGEDSGAAREDSETRSDPS